VKASAIDLDMVIDIAPGSRSGRCERRTSRPRSSLDIVVLGLSITSSWGNGHATTYRALLRELAKRGHRILFLERNAQWYESNRDLPNPPFCRTEIYESFHDLKDRFSAEIRRADLVIVGSYVPDGIAIGNWVTAIAQGTTAFYDIDTPVTLNSLAEGRCSYLTSRLISRYNLYLSFTGGPTLDILQRRYGSRMARPLFCSVDPALYQDRACPALWDLGYMGTYSNDRQPTVERLLLTPASRWKAGRFVAAGPQYPPEIQWPSNVERIEHLSPSEHSKFYNSQRFTLNVTRADMVRAGYSPSVRLFEAAACGTPIISDFWPGLDSFFEIGREILVAHTPEEVLSYMSDVPEAERKQIGKAGQKATLSRHTAAHRAAELEQYAFELIHPTGGGA
jgi:spore maturation protein CgeB